MSRQLDWMRIHQRAAVVHQDVHALGGSTQTMMVTSNAEAFGQACQCAIDTTIAVLIELEKLRLEATK